MNLQTFKDSSINQVSKRVKEYLKENELQPGKIVKFRLLGGTKNIDKDRVKPDEKIYPASVTIPLNGWIIDPGDDNGEEKATARPVQVAAVSRFDEKSNEPQFMRYSIRPSKNDPIFMLKGNDANDMRAYPVLLLSNFNKSNPFRDASIEPKFEMVNEGKEAAMRTQRRSKLKDSLAAIEMWDFAKKRIVAAGFNITTTGMDEATVKDRLESLAEKDPVTFFNTIESEDVKIKAVIKMCTEEGIIHFSPHENKWIMVDSGETLVSLERREGTNETDQFCQFMKSAQNGPKVRKNLETLLSKKK